LYIFFYKIGEQEDRTGRRMVGGWIQCKKCIHMYVNAKMIPNEMVPGIREGEWKRAVDAVNSSMIHLIHSQNLCKYPNVPSPSTMKTKLK
jgi:hypothetical protein